MVTPMESAYPSTAAPLPTEMVQSEATSQVREETAAPAPQPSPEKGSWVLPGALGLTLALLAAVVVLLVRSRRKAPPSEESTVTLPKEETGGRLTVACWQHIGGRSTQQDSFVCTDPEAYPARGLLAAVADGMGGLSNGKVVSEALVRSLEEGFSRSDPKMNGADLLLEMAAILNAQINQMLRGQAQSGSTLAAVVLRDGMLHFFSVGDSRIYLYRGGGLIQLNREHIFQEFLAVRALNRELPVRQIRTDRQAHALSSYFGIGRIPALDRNDEGIRLRSGDKILIASDGVFGVLTASQMERALCAAPEAAVAALGARIAEANLPQQDNSTALVLEYRE